MVAPTAHLGFQIQRKLIGNIIINKFVLTLFINTFITSKNKMDKTEKNISDVNINVLFSEFGAPATITNILN